MTTIRVPTVAAMACAAAGLAGCYVVPMAPDGSPVYPAAVPYASVPAARPAPVVRSAPPPPILDARLYPANEIASRDGVLTGNVANMMNGRGRFVMDYRGETLSGEATRVDGDERRGVASAYGSRGTYMTCDYRMTTPFQGAGVCRLSNGAEYQVHLGS